jgi:hypothetical protein
MLLFGGINLLHVGGDERNHKKKFVPNHYYMKVYNRLQYLSQGFKSVD